MKPKQTNRRTRSGAWLAWIALAVLALGPAARYGSADPGDPPGPPTLSGGGDAIGSLPLTALSMPAFGVQGPASEVQALVKSARGSAHVVATELDGNELRVVFYGDVSLVLDRTHVTRTLRFFLEPGPVFGGGYAGLVLDGRRQGIMPLPSIADAGLPLYRLVRSGLLDSSTLDIHSFSPEKERHHLRMWASGGELNVRSL